jgi:uncharacterized protein DUF5054
MKRREFLMSATLTAAASAALSPWKRAVAQQAVNTPAVQEDVKRVVAVFKCHLDIGFTDTQANVMQKYFKQYYPQATAIAAQRREAGQDRYVWTTGSWLLYEYLEQATSDERRRMEQAIAQGDIAWHSLPFSWQTEMLDRSMIEGCLGLSTTLDRRFGHKTIAGKMTDVPCHSRGIVAPLAAGGVRLLDIGVNPASTPPEVPDVFLWKEPDGSSLAVLYHRHDYGSVVRVPGSDLAVSVAVRSDNSGPHTMKEIDEMYAGLRRQFPNAKIVAGSLSDVATAMEATRANLPVVTGEIGDTWIYGAPSDPPKIARYREMARLRGEWLASKQMSVGDATDRQLLRRLVLAVEHTWGTDTKRYIDHDHYSPKELAEYIHTPGYQTMERSWQEKRDDIDAGVANLPEGLRTEAKTRLETLRVVAPDPSEMQVHDAKKEIRTEHFDLMLDPATGSIAKLVNRKTKKGWASEKHPLALFTYQTLSQADYAAFLAAYVRSKDWWAPQDFGKPNIERFHAESREWHPVLKQMWLEERPEHHRVLAELAVEDPDSVQRGLVAWPASMYIELIFPKAEPVMQLTFYAMGKAPNRMPESMWLTFMPEIAGDPKWSFEKVNQQVSPDDVVRGGGRRMHAVTSRLICGDATEKLAITTLDAPVVALGSRSPLNFSNDLPDLRQGVHVNLFNNAWGTNYPQWAGGDWKYRFTLA